MAAKAPKLHEKPLLVRNGFKFTDMKKVEFTVGKQIGSGGFGRIYEGTQVTEILMEIDMFKNHRLGKY